MRATEIRPGDLCHGFVLDGDEIPAWIVTQANTHPSRSFVSVRGIDPQGEEVMMVLPFHADAPFTRAMSGS
jgi:hypothetical protein